MSDAKLNADAKGTETVFIGCKIPNGLILEVGRQGDANYVRIELQGAANAALGVGITQVRKDHWEAWLGYKNGNSEMNPKHARRELNRELAFMKAGQVFECADNASAQAVGMERQGLLTGFEGLDPMRPGANLTPLDEKTLRQQLANRRMPAPSRVAL